MEEEFKIGAMTLQEDLLYHAVWRYGVNSGMPSKFAGEAAEAAVMFFRSLIKPNDEARCDFECDECIEQIERENG